MNFNTAERINKTPSKHFAIYKIFPLISRQIKMGAQAWFCRYANLQREEVLLAIDRDRNSVDHSCIRGRSAIFGRLDGNSRYPLGDTRTLATLFVVDTRGKSRSDNNHYTNKYTFHFQTYKSFLSKQKYTIILKSICVFFSFLSIGENL